VRTLSRGGSRRALDLSLLLLAGFLLAVVWAGVPALAQEATLSAEQEAVARRVEGELIAPCCWTQTVSVHDSEAAQQIKMQIRVMLQQGKDQQQIVDSFVGQYGEKILAAPRASGFNWLAYLLPFTGMVGAAAILIVAVRRWRGGPAAEAVTVSAAPSPSAPSALDERLRQDLERFDS